MVFFNGRFHFTSSSYQRPGNQRVSAQLAFSALFWTKVSQVIPGIYWSQLPCLGVTKLKSSNDLFHH